MVEDCKNVSLDAISQQLQELGGILDQVMKDKDVDTAWERRDRWKDRTRRMLAERVNEKEATRFAELRQGSFIMGQPLRNFADEFKMYKGYFTALVEEIKAHGDEVLQSRRHADPVQVHPPPENRVIFIVHGHDELNLRRLKDLLKEQWDIDPIILYREPGKGRTLIEKFEQEAQRANFALVLMTPDDFITVNNDEYAQARPNTIFELGWFYGRLGRDRVCILFKKGTKIHSDLDGINRIEFTEDVLEKIMDLKKELKAAGLL